MNEQLFSKVIERVVYKTLRGDFVVSGRMCIKTMVKWALEEYQKMSTINFYHVNKPYGCFSNFSDHAVELDGKIWKTSEHYYQAMKFEDEELQEKVRLTSTPGAAAEMGRDPENPLRLDWDDIKDDVMRKVVMAKFTQNQECEEILLSTELSFLVEDSPVDYYWGCGADRTGKNMLGRVLMEVRDVIKGA